VSRDNLDDNHVSPGTRMRADKVEALLRARDKDSKSARASSRRRIRVGRRERVKRDEQEGGKSRADGTGY
jgi:hypothetical protein